MVTERGHLLGDVLSHLKLNVALVIHFAAEKQLPDKQDSK